MNRSVALFVFLAFGIVLQHSHGIEVNVTNKEGKLCLYANLMANFSVSYEIAGNKTATAEFELPSSAKSVGSECGAKDSLLKLNFGDGHSWSINFTLTGQMYKADLITFSYNLGDKTVFPNSASNETQTATTTAHIDNVGFNTCYSCKSKDTFETTSANQTLWNVLMQAFVSNNSKSEQITSCAADLPTTTVAPTTTPTTTSTTTAAPVTNATSTTPPPTTTPTPTLPTPATGKYEVKSGVNGTACLLATLGLRIGLKQGDKYVEMNINPEGTSASGSCGVNSSELLLESNTTSFTFTFTNDSKKFHLHALNVTGKTSAGVVFSEVNTNLSLWEAAISSSYMCNKEQNYTITGQLTLFTFDLHIQPFGVKKGAFSTAHECSMDDTSILIPIIVGAALAGLILIVVVAYVIGRRKTYVGYQTL